MLKIIALLCACICAPLFAEEKEPMDLVLVLAADVSGSIAGSGANQGSNLIANEYLLQKNGIAKALRDLDVAGVLEQCNSRGVAITYVEWSGSGDRNRKMVRQVLPWTVLRNRADLLDFARQVEQIPERSFKEDTDIASAIKFATQLIVDAPFEASRQIISLSSDGIQNVEPESKTADPLYPQQNRIAHVRKARDEALEKNISVNALLIMNDPDAHTVDSPLDHYFTENIIGGPGSFAHGIHNFQDFAEGLKANLMRELFSCIM
jgi:hypothetical protein